MDMFSHWDKFDRSIKAVLVINSVLSTLYLELIPPSVHEWGMGWERTGIHKYRGCIR